MTDLSAAPEVLTSLSVDRWPMRVSVPTIAALFVETDGVYFNQAGVDPWDIGRDARKYDGPWPVVAHPPCQRWGRFATSHPILGPNQYRLGDDGGCFDFALYAVDKFGGVLEHPKDSKAWEQYEINRPPSNGGWVPAGSPGAYVCCVEQGHYGHFSRKPTWLYWNSGYGRLGKPPELIWGRSPQRIHPRALELHGYAKARRIGMMAMVGGKDKTKIRNATPVQFRDLLLNIARTAPLSQCSELPLSPISGNGGGGGRDFLKGPDGGLRERVLR